MFSWSRFPQDDHEALQAEGPAGSDLLVLSPVTLQVQC